MSTIPTTLRDWQDRERNREWLIGAGLSTNGAETKAHLFAQAAEHLLAAGALPQSETAGCFCPGRLEVLGKHTDYAGGRSLIAAPELGVAMLMVRGTEGRLHGRSAQDPVALEVALNGAVAPQGWGLYPTTVMRRLTRNFPGLEFGSHFTCASDLPLAAGMSSSSALMTATLLCALRLFGLEQDPRLEPWTRQPEARALFASCIENGNSLGPFDGDRGVGTFGGSEDHTAMFCAQAGQLGQYGFAPILLERRIPVPEEVTFVIAQSGITAQKAAGALESYNRLALMVRELERVAGDLGLGAAPLAAILRADPENGARLERGLQGTGPTLRFPAEDLRKRLHHFQLESEGLIPEWPADGSAADAARIGHLAERSTSAARDLLGNQVPETIWLAEALRRAGAFAASPFGAGFGGSVWALIPKANLGAMLETLQAQSAPTPALQAELARAQAIELGPAAIVAP